MCGITGILAFSPVLDRSLLLVMRDAMAHRGPDDAGVWWSGDGRVGLAHRRLSVLDLSPGGHQPMTDVLSELTIVFNGEIYNHLELKKELQGMGHVFRSTSDTEVILEAYRAWGEACLERLEGMFAFGLYDGKAGRLFLARDRIGEKPLFYHMDGQRLVFASELKALMADPAFPRRLDQDSLGFYLAYGYIPGERCILQSVRKLGPGHSLVLHRDGGVPEIRRYWQLPERRENPETESMESLSGELEQLLERSVRRQLVADVPVGILLSGGIDSSLVVAMAARLSSRSVKTFTVSFPGHGAYDEAPHARKVARHFGTEHVELEAESATVGLLGDLARQYDEPLADSSMIPTYLVSRLIRRHATVALGGDGGDELFGGYPHYRWQLRKERWRRWIPGMLGTAMGAVAQRLPVGLKGRHFLMGWDGGRSQGIAHINMYFDATARRRLLPGVFAGGVSPESFKSGLCGRSSLLQDMTTVDFETYLPDDILVKVDRASMLASLEVRAPWLDHRLVEFAFSRVPDDFRATVREGKILSRHLAARWLPGDLDLRRKQGFSIPLHAWMGGEWGDFMEDVLLGAGDAFFDRKMIRSLIAGQRKGYSNAQRLFSLTLFELWRREYRIIT